MVNLTKNNQATKVMRKGVSAKTVCKGIVSFLSNQTVIFKKIENIPPFGMDSGTKKAIWRTNMGAA